MTFGERLRCARKAKQLTQRELAAKINAAHNSISNWETDQNMPDPDTIQNLCWALDVQPNYFFSVNHTSGDSAFSLEQEAPMQTLSKRNIIRIAARNGSYRERILSDEQLTALEAILDQMPDVADDI